MALCEVCRHLISIGVSGEIPDAECSAPVWERAPSRVTFEPKGGLKFTFAIPTRTLDLTTDEDTKEDSVKKEDE